MKSKILCCIVTMIVALCVAAPANAADVAQGKCVSYDKDKGVLVIEEFNTKFSKENKFGEPTGKQSTFNTKEALVGITPTPGDIIRLAYDGKSADKKTFRVMNVTKQDLMKK
ncbi:MAG: hypothetical protein HY912_05575 [Desulfomonile tiedjei]|uniref:DUF5666 domain-containing protein n=1 Tax=Desulfomonile tiedjei TaxID=2358 RepID=A0A9D6UYW2_9BACT|nr:hypothetical protein [Desulfomonile tiedjei]